MARTSFTRCNDCKDQGFPDCRYSERRTEKTPRAAVTASKSAAFTFRTTHTPNIELMYTLPATPRDALQAMQPLDPGLTFTDREFLDSQCQREAAGIQ